MTEEQMARELVERIARHWRRRRLIQDLGTLGLALIPWAFIIAILTIAGRAQW